MKTVVRRLKTPLKSRVGEWPSNSRDVGRPGQSGETVN